MLIKPYEDYTEADTTSANFPALQYAFLPQDVTDGDTVWTDRIAGIDAAPSTGTFTKNASGAVLQTGPTNTYTGTINKPGTKNVILISVMYAAGAAIFQLGDSSATQGIGVSMKTGNNFYTSDDGDYATITPASSATNLGASGNPGVFGVQCDPATGLGEMKGFDCTNAGVFTLNSAGVITTVGDGDLADGVSAYGTEKIFLPVVATTGEAYGHYVFFFTTLPTDLRAAVSWMQANPLKGAYPGWMHRT